MDAINIIIITAVVLAGLLLIGYIFCCYKNTGCFYAVSKKSYWEWSFNNNDSETKYSLRTEYHNANNNDLNTKGETNSSNQIPIAHVDTYPQPSAPNVHIVEATAV